MNAEYRQSLTTGQLNEELADYRDQIATAKHNAAACTGLQATAYWARLILSACREVRALEAELEARQ